MKVQWLDRTLFLGPKVALVMSQDEYRAAIVAVGLEPDDHPFCPDGAKAIAHTWSKDGELVLALVGLHPTALDTDDGIAVAGVLVHEAVHVWQRICDATAKDDIRRCWGTEAEAYAIQNISTRLMQAFAERKFK